MGQITELLTREHRRCDAELARCEEEAAAERWACADAAFAAFAAQTERHFEAEESVLFPRFEVASGMASGPTAVMREEHGEMRGLLDGMRRALAARDRDGFLDCCETMLLMLQQHNLKEEEILYPMTDQALGADADTFARGLGATG